MTNPTYLREFRFQSPSRPERFLRVEESSVPETFSLAITEAGDTKRIFLSEEQAKALSNLLSGFGRDSLNFVPPEEDPA